MTIEDVLRECREIPEPAKRDAFLLGHAKALVEKKRFDELVKLLEQGHAPLRADSAAHNSFVHVGSLLKTYCSMCDRFRLRTDGRLDLVWCRGCDKAFCREHVHTSAFAAPKCPFCRKTLFRSKTKHARYLVSRHGISILFLAIGLLFGYMSGRDLAQPDAVAAQPEAYRENGFEFRYVSVSGTEQVEEVKNGRILRLDADVHGTKLQFFARASGDLADQLVEATRLYHVKGVCASGSTNLVVKSVDVSYGLLGSIISFPYRITRNLPDYRLAVMASTFLIWLVAIVSYNLLLLLIPAPVGDLIDEIRGALG